MKANILLLLIVSTLITSCAPEPNEAPVAPKIPNIFEPDTNYNENESSNEIIVDDQNDEVESKNKIDINDFYSAYMQDDSKYFSKEDLDLIFRANYDNKIIDDIINFNSQDDLTENEIAKLFITLSTDRLINYDVDKFSYLEKILSNISQTPFSVDFETISIENNVRKNGLNEHECILNLLDSNYKFPFYEGTLRILSELYQKCFFTNNLNTDQEVYDLINKIKENYISFNNSLLSEEEKNKIISFDFNNELSNITAKSVLEMQTEFNEEAILKFMIEFTQNNSISKYDPIEFIIYNIKMMNSYQIYKEIDIEVLQIAYSSEIPAKCIYTEVPNKNLEDNNQLDFYKALYTCLKI